MIATPDQRFSKEWEIQVELIDADSGTIAVGLEYWNDDDTILRFSLGVINTSVITIYAEMIREAVETCDWCAPINTTTATFHVRGLPNNYDAEFQLDADVFYGNGFISKNNLLHLAWKLDQYAKGIAEEGEQ